MMTDSLSNKQIQIKDERNRSMKKIAVIGAGPAGLSAAYVLSKNGYSVDVYESNDYVGGFSASFQLWGQTVDLGPHRYFSKDRRVNQLWLEVVKDDYNMIPRVTRILYKNKFFNYPIQLFNALYNLGLYEAIRCLYSCLKEQLFPVKQDGSFETWVQQKFGRRLYELFFKTYSEKLWGIPCTQLDADFAAQRIKQLSLFEAIKNALLEGKGNTHQTLLDQFAYPINGTGTVYEKMAKSLVERGSSLFFKTPIKRILTSDNRVTGVELYNNTIKRYDCVVSSMPYTDMVIGLSEAPSAVKEMVRKLSYRNTLLVYLLINAEQLFPDNWIYVHSKELQMGRITNFSNWDKSLCGDQKKTIIALEYWCGERESLWSMAENELIEKASLEIVQTGLVKASLIEEGKVIRLSKSYPIYQKGYKSVLKPIETYTNSIDGLYAIGRNGSFKYNNQDHSLLMGILAAENITLNKQHDLFSINADYGLYQESCTITQSGLSKTPVAL